MTDPAPLTTPATHVESTPGGLRPFIRVLRPKQWTKNGALLVPLAFAHAIGHPAAVLRVVLAALAFCVISGSVYVFNDIGDREKDRLHPEKRLRPIASGAIRPSVAAVWGTICAAGALTLAGWIATPYLYVCLVYLALQAAYTLRLKEIAVVDVMIIALGFVIRVVAGAIVIGVPVSNWLYLCTLSLALFLGFCKRRHELLLLEGGARNHRANLGEYSPALLDQFIGITAAMTLVSYSLYTMSEDTVRFHHTDNLKLTIPFVIYGVFRYLHVVYKKSEGGSPERVLLGDVPMIVDIILFALVALTVMYWR